MVKHAETGQVLRLAPQDGDGENARPNPADADSWPSDCVMPAPALREALIKVMRKPEECDPRGLRVVGVDVSGRLEIDFLEVPLPFALDHSRLRFGVSASAAHFTSLSLEGSLLVVDPRGTRVAPLDLDEAKVAGTLDMRGATLTNEGGVALSLDGASIGSGAFLDGLTATGEVRAAGATITGQLGMRGATLTNEGGDALSLDGASIGSGASLDGLTATGEVRAPGATIAGELTMFAATLTNEGGVALVLDGASIEGSAFLADGFTATGEVRALGATFVGTLTMFGATLTNEGGDALVLDRARIDGGAFLTDGFTATG